MIDDYQNLINATLDELQSYWQQQIPIFIQKLTQLIVSLEEKNDFAYLFFEYDHYTLALDYYLETKNRNFNSPIQTFATLQTTDITALEVKIDAPMQDDAISDDYNEQYFEYIDNKMILFEKWFIDCWQQSQRIKPYTRPAYFNVYDNSITYDLIHQYEVDYDTLEKIQ